jgi:hypothetical protein
MINLNTNATKSARNQTTVHRKPLRMLVGSPLSINSPQDARPARSQRFETVRAAAEKQIRTWLTPRTRSNVTLKARPYKGSGFQEFAFDGDLDGPRDKEVKETLMELGAGARIGYLDGQRVIGGRRKTKQNSWCFDVSCVGYFLEKQREKREGQCLTRKVEIILHEYYQLNERDEDILQNHANWFPSLKAVTSLPQRIVAEGFEPAGSTSNHM